MYGQRDESIDECCTMERERGRDKDGWMDGWRGGSMDGWI